MAERQRISVSIGDGVHDDDGARLGTVRGFDEDGFYVSMGDDVEAPTPSTSSTGGAGEIDLMWRCWQCGEIGRISEIPDECPSCSAGREELYYWTED